jgi:hypothetical protein
MEHYRSKRNTKFRKRRLNPKRKPAHKTATTPSMVFRLAHCATLFPIISPTTKGRFGFMGFFFGQGRQLNNINRKIKNKLNAAVHKAATTPPWLERIHK